MKRWIAMGAMLAAGTAGVSAAEKPNVIYILADDLGYGEVGYNGQEMIQTPELDAMAKDGMRFANHYCGNQRREKSATAIYTDRFLVPASPPQPLVRI